MKPYQIVLLVILFILIGFFIGNKESSAKKLLDKIITNSNTDTNVGEAGKVDLWCDNGKYYKRTTTTVLGQPILLELTKAEFDVLVSQGISYSGCTVDNNGIVIA